MVTAITFPAIVLTYGLYGSFLFTFTIPLFWQVGVLCQPIASLGLKKKFILRSIFIGLVSGMVLGLLGGNILKFLGMSNFSLDDIKGLQYYHVLFNFDLVMKKETGYQLLTKSNTFLDGFLYLLFSVFVIGLGEEVFWRGFIQQKLSRYLPQKAIAVWLTAALFSLMHIYILTVMPINTGIIFLVLIALAAVAWGYLFLYIGNIWAVAISHGLTAFIIWKYYFFRG